MNLIDELGSIMQKYYNICDAFDTTSFGIFKLTNGKLTQRELLKTELFKFVLYLVLANGSITTAEAGLLNYIWGERYNPRDYLRLSDQVYGFQNETLLTLRCFVSADKEAIKNGENPNYGEFIIKLFDTVGSLCIKLDDNNPSVHTRYTSYIKGMRDYIVAELGDYENGRKNTPFVGGKRK